MSRRGLYRESKRLLAGMLIGRWKGSRQAIEPLVRRFLRDRPPIYLSRLVRDRGFAIAAVASLLAAGEAGPSPPINLSDVAAGSGGFVINGIDPSDLSGACVSGAGDVNGDGLADVVVGASGGDPAGNSFAGESYVVFGKAEGTAVSLWEVTAGIGGFVINGIDPDDFSGASVSGAGDVNGDGLADIIVGAPRADPGGHCKAGESWVVFGKADGTPVNLSDVDGGIGGFVINGNDPIDFSGICVSGAGDVNGDGLADLIVGASHADPSGQGQAGESYVVFGKADGAAVNLSDVASGNGGFVINGVDYADETGTSVSGAGDVNGDGLADVVVGAPQASAGENDNWEGQSWVVFGKADGMAVNLAAVTAGTGGFVINGNDPDGRAGQSVSDAGDVNGDGLADLIVGAPRAGKGSSYHRGESYVVFGKADGTAVNLSAVATGIGGFVIIGIDEYTGTSVSGAGDMNGDGLADVIVSSPYADPAGYPGKAWVGKSYVVFGKLNGRAVNLSDIAAGNGGFVIIGIDVFDQSGRSVSDAGDVNGDGLTDVVVGASDADPGGNISAGETYVVFSPVVRGDLDGDGSVGKGDFQLLLGAWGPCATACPPHCPGDLDGDCTVGIVDFLLLLGNWS